MKTFIKGTYKRSIFTSNQGYNIGLFKITETNDEELNDYKDKIITFTGYFHELSINDNYIFYGSVKVHPRYGFQYDVLEYEKIMPNDTDGIVMFLCSDLFKGIGQKQAESIVNVLGEDALNIIIENKSSLLMVPKLSEKKIDIIYNTLIQYTESHKTIVYLTELGFAMRDALTIYNLYKKNTKLKLEENIYNLMFDIDGITFSKIDEIALRQNISATDPRRIKAAIWYILNNLTFSTGNTYFEYEEIYDELYKYLNYEIPFDEFEQYLSVLVNERKLFKDEYKYYLYDTYMDERLIVNKIRILLLKEENKYKDLDKLIINLEKLNRISYNELQKEAIISSFINNISIITGGPGTGKTTIIRAITDIYKHLYGDEKIEEKIALLAPTGRASKRMSEATNMPAYTIHRFLKWNKENNSFAVDEYNPNSHHLIIIDEVSMIDINLMASLFRGLTDNIKIIMVGDYNQLPSVGPGQLLKDLIESKKIPTIKLETLYRQNEDSYINQLASEININEMSNEYLKKHDDYNFLECSDYNLKGILENLTQKLLKKYDPKKMQFMAPLYKGENGIDNLNKLLQNILNPEDETKEEIKYGDIVYREEDRVLQLVNMPDDNVFNGDIGYIKKIIKTSLKSKKNEIHVDFDGTIVKYESGDFNKIKHGFVISIHKSQGSEFEVVILPILSSYRRMLYKKLIYTGITRTKEKLIIIGESNAFIFGVANNLEQERKTDLLNKLYRIK